MKGPFQIKPVCDSMTCTGSKISMWTVGESLGNTACVQDQSSPFRAQGNHQLNFCVRKKILASICSTQCHSSTALQTKLVKRVQKRSCAKATERLVFEQAQYFEQTIQNLSKGFSPSPVATNTSHSAVTQETEFCFNFVFCANWIKQVVPLSFIPASVRVEE